MTKSLRPLSLLPLAAVAVLVALPAQATPSTPDFVKNAAIGNMFEIQSSQLAAQNSQNDSVKQFAQQMITDHTNAGDQLKQIVTTDSSLPQPPAALDRSHQKMLDKLQKETGKDFDKDYVKYQNDSHKDAIKLFASYSKSGDNPALKSFAGSALPEFKEHEAKVKQLKSSI